MSSNHLSPLAAVTRPLCRTAAVASPTSVPAAQAHDVPPLQWWRRLPADAFTTSHLQTIRKAISGIGMVGEPRWPDAVRGCPAAAIGVALRHTKKRRTPSPIVDLIMSTLLVSAIAGNPAATMVLANMIERKAAASEKQWLKRSWLRQQRENSVN